MTKKRRRRHTPEQIVSKLRDADAMLNAGKDLAVVRVRDINGRLVAWFILGLFPGIFDAEVDGGSVSAW